MLMVMVMIMILVIRLVLWCINHHRYFCCHYDSLCVIKYCFWIVLLLLPCFMMLVAICKDMALVRALMCSPLADTIGLEQHLSTPSILFHTHCLLFGVIFLTSSFIFVAQVGLMVFTVAGVLAHFATTPDPLLTTFALVLTLQLLGQAASIGSTSTGRRTLHLATHSYVKSQYRM